MIAISNYLKKQSTNQRGTNMKTIIAPSLLSADFKCLETEIKNIEEAGADWLHFDVMDGHFVPNLSFGVDVMKGLKKLTDRLMDVHLMVNDPGYYTDVFAKAGADLIIGTHPHVIEPVKWVEADNGNKALCYYLIAGCNRLQKLQFSLRFF